MAEKKKEKNWLDLFTACPFCGSREGLRLMSGEDFYSLQSAHGSAVVSVSCRNCSLDMYEHTYEERKYEHRVKLLARKWNGRAFGD